MLPDCDKWRNAILTVVKQNDPRGIASIIIHARSVFKMIADSHSIRIHTFADEELVIFEATDDLLCI